MPFPFPFPLPLAWLLPLPLPLPLSLPEPLEPSELLPAAETAATVDATLDVADVLVVVAAVAVLLLAFELDTLALLVPVELDLVSLQTVV